MSQPDVDLPCPAPLGDSDFSGRRVTKLRAKFSAPSLGAPARRCAGGAVFACTRASLAKASASPEVLPSARPEPARPGLRPRRSRREHPLVCPAAPATSAPRVPPRSARSLSERGGAKESNRSPLEVFGDQCRLQSNLAPIGPRATHIHFRRRQTCYGSRLEPIPSLSQIKPYR